MLTAALGRVFSYSALFSNSELLVRCGMCYSVYLSTTCPDDLSLRNSELVRFERASDPASDPCTGLLGFPHQWYVGSKSHCSCTFRHLASPELGFFDPVDWIEEGQDDIDATRELYLVLFSLFADGYQVDIIDRWEGVLPEDVKTLDVLLNAISQSAFVLFENHRFRFT